VKKGQDGRHAKCRGRGGDQGKRGMNEGNRTLEREKVFLFLMEGIMDSEGSGETQRFGELKRRFKVSRKGRDRRGSVPSWGEASE